MAAITLQFDGYEEMKSFARKLIQGDEPQQPMQVSTQLPISTPVDTIAQTIQQPVPAPQAPQATQQPEPVATSTTSYTLNDLAGAAMTLMDKGMQAQLQQLLAGYGVDALPALPMERYGEFATALRGLGAQI